MSQSAKYKHNQLKHEQYIYITLCELVSLPNTYHLKACEKLPSIVSNESREIIFKLRAALLSVCMFTMLETIFSIKHDKTCLKKQLLVVTSSHFGCSASLETYFGNEQCLLFLVLVKTCIFKP